MMTPRPTTWMPPRLQHVQPTAPAAPDSPAFDLLIATLLLGLDLVVVADTGEQPRQAGPPTSGGSVANRASGYHPAMQQPNPETAPSPPPRVLIADDAPAMRAALRGLLEDHGLPVIGEAADGLQAVTMAAHLQPDIIVMDVRMPGLDGLQATTRITGSHPHVCVVVYSVFDSDATRQAAHLAGAAAFVAKHAPPDQVPAAVLATWQAASTTPTPPAAPPSDRSQTVG
jgi:CheY-like chemotaxis protein